MPKLTLAALTSGHPAQLPDPAIEGLRYRVRTSGKVYAELRWKDGPGTWTSHPLGRVDVEERIADILEEEHDGSGSVGLSISLERVLDPWRTKARELKRQLRKGEAPGGKDTLLATAELYLRHVVKRPATQRERERYLLKAWAPLHNRPLTAITRREIASQLLAIKEASAKGPGIVAANRARSALSSLFTWAIGQGLVEASPVLGAGKAGDEPSRSRVLALEELRALWAALEGSPAEYRDIVKLLALTGQRREEVGGMRWEELDLERGMWTLPPSRTKNKRPHQVPLSTPAVAILEAIPRRPGNPFVFGGHGYVNWPQSKARLDARLSLPAWTLHDIRRSVVTGMAEMGVEPHVIEAAINHQSGHKAGVAGRYNLAAYAPQKAAAMRAWASHLLDEAPAKVIRIHA